MEGFFQWLSKVPAASEGEVVEEFLRTPAVRFERIVSHGQVSPPGFWYDQEEHEWVMVLSGKAVIAIQGSPTSITLGPADALHLPAHVRHRVEWTDPSQPTVWCAVYWASGA